MNEKKVEQWVIAYRIMFSHKRDTKKAYEERIKELTEDNSFLPTKDLPEKLEALKRLINERDNG